MEPRPGFTGVVLYNLAVAFQTKACQVLEKSPDKAEQLKIEASGTMVQALYMDTSLLQEENFYRNPVMKPLLRHLLGCFQQAAQYNQEASGPA